MLHVQNFWLIRCIVVVFYEIAVPFIFAENSDWKSGLNGKRHYLFSVLTGTTKIFCSICLDNLQCRQPLGRTRNITGIL